MAQYVLRSLPDDQWTEFQERAQRDGWPLRALFLAFVDEYAAGKFRPATHAPMTEYDWLRPHYRVVVEREGAFLKMPTALQWQLLQAEVTKTLDAQRRQTATTFFAATVGPRREAVLRWLAAPPVLTPSQNASAGRHVVIGFNGGQALDLPVAEAFEQDGCLVLYDENGRTAGRFPMDLINNWYVAS